MNDTRRELVRFLREDIGRGDITSGLLSGKKEITGEIITREECIVAGARHAAKTFRINKCRVIIKKKDGNMAKKNDVIMSVSGRAASVLSAERTALNLLARMSGIATATGRLVRLVRGRSEIYATRKTAPGLRRFDKEAVVIGGGRAHRMSLDESVLIKDNHIISSKGLEDIIRRARQKNHKRIQVEVETPAEAEAAVGLGVRIIMLDNFDPAEIIRVVARLKKTGMRDKVILEASGGITEKNIAGYARTGVDRISAGFITSSPRAIDMSLEIARSTGRNPR